MIIFFFNYPDSYILREKGGVWKAGRSIREEEGEEVA